MSRVIASKYELGPVLGRGGMGEVYEATDTTTGREVAVKVMRLQTGADTADGSEETEREWEVRFDREVQAIESLHSQHVVEVLDAGIDPDSQDRYLVMERLRGEDLSSLGKRLGPLPPELVLRLVAQALLGLDIAHASGIVHRDIKPGNLFLTSDAERRMVRILDFGIARLGKGEDGGDDLTELTRTGSMLGSPHYMAPEQVRGARHADLRADIWSMGVVMYRLLTGRNPHRSEDGVGGLLVAICTVPAPPIQPRAPWVSPEIARIVHRALELRKEDRFASARAMYDAVVAQIPGGAIDIDDRMLVGLTEADRAVVAESIDVPISLPPSAPRIEIDSHAAVSSQTFAMTPPARPRTAAVGAIAAALVVAAAGIAYALVPRPAPSPPAVAAPVPTEITAEVRVPAETAVMVDGVPAAPANGAIVIRGKPGSMHMVQVAGGAITPVLLAEAGAVPSAITLPPALPVASTAPAATTAPRRPDAVAPRPVKPAAPPSAPSTGLRNTFE